MKTKAFALLSLVLLAGFVLAQEPKKEEAKKEEPKKDVPAPVAPPAGASSDYYPLVKGSKWTYTMGTTEVVVEVESIDAKDGSAKLVTKHQGKPVASETILVKADGIYRTKINDTAIDGAGIKILGLKDGKPTKGEKWAIAAKVQQSEVKGEFETKELEAVIKSPAGADLKAVFVEGPKFTIAGTETAVKYYFVPKQGIVQLSYTIGGTESAPLQLKSYELAK